VNAIKIGKHADQLRKRREKVALTLQHIGNEQAEVEQNTDWLDRAAYESRIELFDRLKEWYLHEMREIDEALDRIKQDKYGVCLACHNLIEADRLDFFPQAAFCTDCQTTREALQTFEDSSVTKL
jgi:DnaK suppressor protein